MVIIRMWDRLLANYAITGAKNVRPITLLIPSVQNVEVIETRMQHAPVLLDSSNRPNRILIAVNVIAHA